VFREEKLYKRCFCETSRNTPEITRHQLCRRNNSLLKPTPQVKTGNNFIYTPAKVVLIEDLCLQIHRFGNVANFAKSERKIRRKALNLNNGGFIIKKLQEIVNGRVSNMPAQ
jgi:hypothetical protein